MDSDGDFAIALWTPFRYLKAGITVEVVFLDLLISQMEFEFYQTLRGGTAVSRCLTHGVCFWCYFVV